jgi:hypothetical protein
MGNANLDEAIQNIAVMFHEHFGHDEVVSCSGGGVEFSAYMTKSASDLPSKPAYITVE